MDLLADVFGNTIVVTRFNAGRAAIFHFDVTSGALTELDPQPITRRRQPDIGSSTVAWEDHGTSAEDMPEIFVHDLTTGVTTALTDDELPDTNPMVSSDGTVVVWQKCLTIQLTGCDIWVATRAGSTWTTSQVTSGDNEDALPVTNGDVVVYQSTQGGETDIAWTPLSGGAEQRLSLPGSQRSPAVSGDLISFTSEDPDAGYRGADIMVYDLNAGVLYPITESPDEEKALSDISVGDDGVARVIYSSRAFGTALDLYAFTFAVPDQDATPPELQLPGDMVVEATSPAGATVNYEATAADDSDPNPSLACEPPSGSVFAIGTTTVECTATDAAGHQTTGTFTVTVRGASEQIGDLVALIESFDLHRGTENSLKIELWIVELSLKHGRTLPACVLMEVFTHHVQIMEGRRLTEDQASQLIEAATRIKAVIDCS